MTLNMAATRESREAGAALGRHLRSRMSLAHAGRVIRHQSSSAIAQVIRGERRLTAWQEPAGVRVDSCCRRGDAVLPWYDPLLATVTVSGSSREDVLARARAAVDDFRVEGVRTTLPRLARVLADPSLFVA